MFENETMARPKFRYTRLCLPAGGTLLGRSRLIALGVTTLVLALVGAAALLLPAPAAAPVRTGAVYMISVSGKVRVGDFIGSPRYENGLFIWRDKKGAEYRTVASVIFETR